MIKSQGRRTSKPTVLPRLHQQSICSSPIKYYHLFRSYGISVQEIGSENNWTTPLKGFSDPYLRCLSFEEADYVMREVHEGIYGNHSKSQSLVHKVVQARYYWPTMQKDAHAYVKTYDKCQRFGNLIRQPTEELTPMTVP